MILLSFRAAFEESGNKETSSESASEKQDWVLFREEQALLKELLHIPTVNSVGEICNALGSGANVFRDFGRALFQFGCSGIHRPRHNPNTFHTTSFLLLSCFAQLGPNILA